MGLDGGGEDDDLMQWTVLEIRCGWKGREGRGRKGRAAASESEEEKRWLHQSSDLLAMDVSDQGILTSHCLSWARRWEEVIPR